MAQHVKVTLLGGLHVQQGERAITRFRTQKVGALLAYLAFNVRQSHPREVLADTFWPESTGDAGRNSLSTALCSLRNQLEPPGTPANAVIRADRFSVGLNPAVIRTDVAEFEAALKAAGRGDSVAEQAHHLADALDHYHGRLLPGYYDDWIAPEAERLAGLYVDASSRLAGILEAAGDVTGALQYAIRAASSDPLREEAHLQLMRLFAAAGQPGAALRQYKELELALDEALGAEPSAPLRALVREIEKQSGFAAPRVVPAGAVRNRTASPLPLSMPPGGPSTISFLCTEIPGAARLQERAPEEFHVALETHDRVVRGEIVRHGGREVSAVAGAFVVAFATAASALACAVESQQGLAREQWPGPAGALKVRMALHTGDVQVREVGYHGPVLHRAMHVLTAAHGGQILVTEATAGLLPREPVGLARIVDLGAYRLRDASLPERLFQVDFPGMPAEGYGPVAAEAGHASNLPQRFTRFFGREDELARLRAMLGIPAAGRSGVEGKPDPPDRLVTLTGPGGTGKTRLALEVAEQMLEPYAGAVWFAEMQGVSRPASIPGALLDAMRVPVVAPGEPIDQVTAVLARQRCLLVLDCFEHLIGSASGEVPTAGSGEGRGETADLPPDEPVRTPALDTRGSDGAAIIMMLLERAPSLTILVTSQRVLGLSGEREFPVTPLAIPTPADAGSPERLTVYHSVRLFVNRAQAVMPYFQVTSGNAPAVAELCQRLEGIPLAIELAAARASVMTPDQMLAQVAQRFEFLVSRKRDIHERHRTLAAALDWSYRLLTPDLQRFFTRLSVFRNGWTLEAAAAVCEEPLALDGLAQLRECSLVLAEEHADGFAMRFCMLDTLREYGWRMLHPDERRAMQRQHAHHYLDAREPAVGSLEAHAAWLRRMDAEAANLRAAVEWGLTADGEAELVARGLLSLAPFFYMRHHLMPDVLEWTRRLAAMPGDGCEPVTLAALLRQYAFARANVGDTDGGFADFGRAAAIFRGLEMAEAEAECLYQAARKRSDDPAMRAAKQRMAQLRGEDAAASPEAPDAYLLWNAGDFAGARECYRSMVEGVRATGPWFLVADWLDGLGQCAALCEDMDEARSCFEEALSIRQACGCRHEVGTSLEELGWMAFRTGRYRDAERLYRESFQILRLSPGEYDVVPLLWKMGMLALRSGDAERAAALHGAEARWNADNWPAWARKRYDARVAEIREALGDAAFAAAWETGRAMTLQQAVACAFGGEGG